VRVAKASLHSIMVLTHYRIVTVVLYAPLRLSPTRTLQRVGENLGEAIVFG